MKKLYDRHVEDRVFAPGDRELALLPIVTSPFQAKFSGPYSVLMKVSDQNYVIATADRRSYTQLCHVNLLKPYHAHVGQLASQEQVFGARPACLSVPASSVVVAEQGGNEVLGPDEVILCGRLKTLSLSEIWMFCSAIWIFPNATS